MMQQYVYDTDTIQNISDAHMQTIKELAAQLLNNEQLWPEIDELSAKQGLCVWWFAHSLGSIDMNAKLLPRVLKAQDRTQLIMPDFQQGYITGMLQNSIENAIDHMHNVVTSGKQKLHCFSWNDLCTKLEDVPETSLEKLVCSLLMCDSRSRSTVSELCARYYDKNDNVPRYVLDILLDIHSDVLSSPNSEFHYWKKLLIKSIKIHSPGAKFILELLRIALEYSRKPCTYGSWPEILTAMLEQNKKVTWKSILRLMEESENHVKIKRLLKNRTGVLDDSVALEVIQKWTNDDMKHRPSIMASVLPNDLDTMTRWISLYHKKNKSEIALRLLNNILTGIIKGTYEEHYREKIKECEVAKKNASEGVVLDWLKGYEAELLFRLGNVLQFQMFDAFGVGKTESLEEKDGRDSLRQWLGECKGVRNMSAFLKKFDSEKDGTRRLDGNIWHGKLIKSFYSDDTFLVTYVEYKRKREGGKPIDVDIKLIDKNNPREQINIQVWEGTSETGHGIRRMMNTGIPPNVSGFDWPKEHTTLEYKIKQLPKTGQNFVINKSSDSTLSYIKSYDLLTNCICVMQVRESWVNVYHLSSFKYMKTARKIIEILGLKPVFLKDDWSSRPDGMNNLLAASYSFDPYKVHGDGGSDSG